MMFFLHCVISLDGVQKCYFINIVFIIISEAFNIARSGPDYHNIAVLCVLLLVLVFTKFFILYVTEVEVNKENFVQNRFQFS